jgi:hypothetical protein
VCDSATVYFEVWLTLQPSHSLFTDDRVFIPLNCCGHKQRRMVDGCTHLTRPETEVIGLLGLKLRLFLRPDRERRNVLAVTFRRRFGEGKLRRKCPASVDECINRGSNIPCKCGDGAIELFFCLRRDVLAQVRYKLVRPGTLKARVES